MPNTLPPTNLHQKIGTLLNNTQAVSSPSMEKMNISKNGQVMDEYLNNLLTPILKMLLITCADANNYVYQKNPNSVLFAKIYEPLIKQFDPNVVETICAFIANNKFGRAKPVLCFLLEVNSQHVSAFLIPLLQEIFHLNAYDSLHDRTKIVVQLIKWLLPQTVDANLNPDQHAKKNLLAMHCGVILDGRIEQKLSELIPDYLDILDDQHNEFYRVILDNLSAEVIDLLYAKMLSAPDQESTFLALLFQHGGSHGLFQEILYLMHSLTISPDPLLFLRHAKQFVKNIEIALPKSPSTKTKALNGLTTIFEEEEPASPHFTS